MNNYDEVREKTSEDICRHTENMRAFYFRRQPHNRLSLAQLQLIVSVYLILYSLFISGCASWFGFPTYYDQTTYKNLTDLKAEVTQLYDTFQNDEVASEKISAIRLRLSQVYEYELGKGEKNSETTRQVQIIQEMFERHVDDRLIQGIWSQTHLENKKQIIAQAFNIAIRTERVKNKNE